MPFHPKPSRPKTFRRRDAPKKPHKSARKPPASSQTDNSMRLPKMSPSELLRAGLEELQIAPVPLADRLLQYLGLLAKWNPALGIVAPASSAQWVVRHLLDSLALLPILDAGLQGQSVPPAASHLLDVGTGAGLPGLPLALARPDLRFTLLDSRRRVATFVRQATLELHLKNVQVVCERIEKHQPLAPPALVVARAVAPLPGLISLLQHLPAPTGQILVPLGPKPTPSVRVEGWEIRYNPLKVPFMQAERGVICAGRLKP